MSDFDPNKHSYFTRDEILMGRDKQHPITPEQSDNLDDLIRALNPVRHLYGAPLFLSSGYRPSMINSNVGGAKRSAHMQCQAVDIIDKDGLIANWVLNHLTLLEENGIFMEDPRYTKGWIHLDIRGPKSGKRVFIP